MFESGLSQTLNLILLLLKMPTFPCLPVQKLVPVRDLRRDSWREMLKLRKPLKNFGGGPAEAEDVWPDQTQHSA